MRLAQLLVVVLAVSLHPIERDVGGVATTRGTHQVHAATAVNSLHHLQRISSEVSAQLEVQEVQDSASAPIVKPSPTTVDAQLVTRLHASEGESIPLVYTSDNVDLVKAKLDKSHPQYTPGDAAVTYRPTIKFTELQHNRLNTSGCNRYTMDCSACNRILERRTLQKGCLSY